MTGEERSAARAALLAEWQARVMVQLAAAAGSDEPDLAGTHSELAATIVGMFDAGARDAEVVAFLRGASGSVRSLGALTHSQLVTLAADLHRAADRR